MKKYIAVLFLCLAVAGCESVPVQKTLATDPGMLTRRFISLTQLRTGLTRAETASLIGKNVVTGYELTDATTGQYTPITVANPYRTETMVSNSRAFTVDYYLVGIKVADDKVNDDELVPLVFSEDRLVGTGWDYLNQYIKRSPSK